MTLFDMRKHIPNIITLCNLFLGCCAIMMVLGGAYQAAVYCLLGCFLCDYADGMIARALGVSSPLGKELDSLADVVSFGVLPGVFIYQVLVGLNGQPLENGVLNFSAFGKCAPAFILSACAALRLGKFNLDTRQTTYFLGLSTPATTIFVVGVCMAILTQEPAAQWLNQNIIIYALVPILCALMLSDVKLLGLKLNPKVLTANAGPALGLIGACVLISVFGYTGAACTILAYIGASLIYFARKSS